MENKLLIAFDIDGTLLQNYPVYPKGSYPRELQRTEIVEFLKVLKKAGHEIVIWSGGGKDYVEQTVRDLKIEEYVDYMVDKLGWQYSLPKQPDVAFDDVSSFSLAKVNITV